MRFLLNSLVICHEVISCLFLVSDVVNYKRLFLGYSALGFDHVSMCHHDITHTYTHKLDLSVNKD